MQLPRRLSNIEVKLEFSRSDRLIMKTRNQLFISVVGFVLMLAAPFEAVHSKTAAQKGGGSKNLPLVFDPQTKKYFIGGSSRFTLKEGENSGFIDRIEVSVDGGEYRPYDREIEFKTEGKHTLKFRAVNPVNNWSPVQFVEVFVDLTSPKTEAKFPDEHFHATAKGTYVALRSEVALVSQDNLSGVASIEYSWDGQQFTPYSKPIEVSKEGAQKLYYRSTDRVGNQEIVKSVDLIADGTHPATSLKLQGSTKSSIMNNMTYVSDSVAFALEASDGGSAIKQTWISIDDKPTLYLNPVFLLQEGPHTITYWSVDNVGNKEEPKTFRVYTVSTPPKTLATPIGEVVNTGGINYATRAFQLKLQATDNVVGVDRIEVKVDKDADFRPYIEPLSFQATGFHTISYRAVDRAGNVEPTRIYNVNIHEAAPETSISTAQPIINRDGVSYSPSPNIITLNVGSSVVGVKQTMVSVNDGAYQLYQGPITLTNDQKVYKISFKSIDRLGNEETPKSSTYNMIGTIPMVDLFISNGQSQQEQVRADFLERPGEKSAVSADEGSVVREGFQSMPGDRAPASASARPMKAPTQLPAKKKPAKK